MLAVVVTVQVQLLVPEFTVSHCADSEKFSSRNQSIGCALAWVTLARGSDFNYPFNPVGQFRRICAGHKFSPFLSVGRLCGNCFLSRSTVFTERCDWTNVGHPADLFKGIQIDSNFPIACWHPWSFIVVLTAPKTSNFDLIWWSAYMHLLYWYSTFANSCPLQTDTFLFPLIHSHNVILSSNKC